MQHLNFYTESCRKIEFFERSPIFKLSNVLCSFVVLCLILLIINTHSSQTCSHGRVTKSS